MSKKPHTETTSADKTSIGFDFQYYFFILKLLNLKADESIGLEVLDDVHTSKLDNDCQIYYQVKHTIHEDTNLTTRDHDLWKTLSNWSKVISDKDDGRANEKEQLTFLRKSEFVLFSNKLDSGNNEIINLINDLKQSLINIDSFTNGLNSIKSGTKSDTTITYISDLLSLGQEALQQFLLKINFELGQDDIFEKIYEALKVKMVDEKHIKQVFRDLDSDMRRDNFVTIKSGEKFEVSFEEFYAKYKIYFQFSASKLLIRPFNSALPSILEMKEQIFINQLLDIKDFEVDDEDRLTRLTTHMLKLKDNIFTWFENGEITHNRCDDFHSNTKSIWENTLVSNKRGGLTQNKSLAIIDELRKEKLSINDQELDVEMSNGEFYHLSNIPEIGWTLDWEKYIK